jgi:TonB family protein
MDSIKLRKEKNDVASAISISLLIHIALGAFLAFSLSTNSISSPQLNGLKLVWVSLDSQTESIGRKINNDHSRQSSPEVRTITEKPLNTELAEKEGYGLVVAEKFNNINYSIANEISDKISNLNTVIAYPLYKENAPPVYPEIARVRGYEGIVLVFAEILPDGRVGKIKIRKSSGYAILDQSAIKAVKPWKFEPAKKSGSPFTAWVELPIKFILNNDSQS